ncbi:HIRAN domain-containing protein [Pelagibaculum spongiae]|uniref:HIRAN domain-containing protein n=1 Tax=Pelagibaculum spongiae TaxID=2080658 RepID=A0A2V1GT32_9GAMM|nr:HIRAN domain-containing protein [Pelagibaculum spongiae]PVZ64523.1 hypothetical protein DC094_19625 [Pelagibaculum spongiae]
MKTEFYKSLKILAEEQGSQYRAETTLADGLKLQVNFCYSCDDAISMLKEKIDRSYKKQIQVNDLRTERLRHQSMKRDVVVNYQALGTVEKKYQKKTDQSFVRLDTYSAVKKIYCYIAGVKHKNKQFQIDRQNLLKLVYPGYTLQLIREPENIHDRNAIAIVSEFGQLGYIPAKLTGKLANSELVKAVVNTLKLSDNQTITCDISVEYAEKTSNSEKPFYQNHGRSSTGALPHSPYYQPTEPLIDNEHSQDEDTEVDYGYAEELDWEDRF